MDNEERDRNWSEEDQVKYSMYLRQFCDNFMEGMMKLNIDPFGFVFLFIRSSEAESIDIANNMDRDSLIVALKEALRMIEASEPSQSPDCQNKTHTPSPEESEANQAKAEVELLH